ncbi:MAG: hypothetical protein M3264_03360 [Thermoproteota archaeon]|nr:hypothetical protein [Thermoproteota archaeon]
MPCSEDYSEVKYIIYLFLSCPSSSYHPLINPIVNPAADILPVNGIPKIVIANDENDENVAAA